MVWSESVGQTVTVPGDKDTSDPTDKRDFITLGSDVPPELSDYLTAGLFFQGGKYIAGATYMQIKYFGMGSKNTYFFLFVYVENYKNVAGDHRLVNLSSYLFDDDYSLLSTFGPYDQQTGTPLSAINMVTKDAPFKPQQLLHPISVVSVNAFYPGWSDYNSGWSPLTYWLTPDGVAHLTGLITCGGGLSLGANSYITRLPAILWPLKNMMFTGMANNATSGKAEALRLDVQSNGEVAIIASPAIPFPNYVSINCHWPTKQILMP